MNYLHDKKLKRKKIIKIVLVVLVFFSLIYFRNGIFAGLSRVSHFVFRPVLSLGKSVGEGFSDASVFFSSKKSLIEQNENIKYELEVVSGKLASYNSILSENIRLREILGRKGDDTKVVLSNILSKPNRSPYDTLIIDAGVNQGVSEEAVVLALGFLPIGRVSEVYASSSKVILFSSPGERTEVVISERNIFLEAVGRGGGNFEVILPRDLELLPGTEAILPGTNAGLVATVATTTSDPRDAFKKVLLTSPVNIQELKFVQVKVR